MSCVHLIPEFKVAELLIERVVLGSLQTRVSELMWTPPANLTVYQMRPSDTGPLLKSVWVALYGAHPRAMFAISHFSVFRSSPVARGRLNPPAGMPGPTHKQKIVRAFFQKRAIELQTAVVNVLLVPNKGVKHRNGLRKTVSNYQVRSSLLGSQRPT